MLLGFFPLIHLVCLFILGLFTTFACQLSISDVQGSLNTALTHVYVFTHPPSPSECVTKQVMSPKMPDAATNQLLFRTASHCHVVELDFSGWESRNQCYLQRSHALNVE